MHCFPLRTFALVVTFFLTSCSTYEIPSGSLEPPTAPKAKVSRAAVGYERASLGPKGGRRGLDLGLRYPPVERVSHPEVEFFLAKFRSSPRWHFGESAGRKNQYVPMIESTLSRYGLPLELTYVAFIESHFNPKARSRDGSTVGMWQFSKSTAQAYGLKVDARRDERTDPVKSSDAAARFLAGLYDSFGDWSLVIAAYNAGPARVRRAVSDGGTRDVFELFARGLLPQTSREFVAKFLALATLSVDWEGYGISEYK